MHNGSILSFLLIFTAAFQLLAQSDSVTVNLDQIEHLSQYERSTFDALAEGEENWPACFAALNGDQLEADHLYIALKTYGESLRKDSEKNVKKFAKNMHELLHSNILKYYEDVATLNETLEKGKYNCVSATAMYALVCEELSIDYQIRETPVHVYTIIDPKGENIVLESTDPSKKGYYTISDNFKERYISFLEDNKLISPEDRKNLSKDEIFDQSYFAAKIIGLRQLAGIQYYNDGILLIEKEEYKKALSQFEKSYLLYPNENTLLYLPLVAGSVIDYSTEAEQTQLSFIPFLSKYLNYSNSPDAKPIILQLFNNIGEDMVMENGDVEQYQLFADSLVNSIQDSSAMKEIKYFKHTTLGRYYGFRRQSNLARTQLSEASRINKNNVQLQSMLAYAAYNEFRLIMEDSEVLVDSLDNFCKEFPLVCDYPELIELRAIAKIAEVFNQHKDDDDDDLARQAVINRIDEIEDIIIKLPPNAPSKIPNIYSDIAASEFRKENIDSAISWLKRGLKYFPENKDLKERLKNMERFKKDGSY